MVVFCNFLHLPSNGVNVKIALGDFDLLFLRTKIKNVNISETVRVGSKSCIILNCSNKFLQVFVIAA